MTLLACSKKQKNKKILQLVLSEKCNLSCVYCYEHNKDASQMPLDVAKRAIENAFMDGSTDVLEIDFFGGEPFAEFENMKHICEWLWNIDWPKPFIVFATTNGTIVHGDIKNWVYKNRHRLILGVSLDGTPEMHNLNRNNSFDQIDLDFFSSVWPFQPVKMTVSPLTLPFLADGVIYLHHRGFIVSCNNAYGIQWEDEDYPIFAEQLKKLADFYIENPDIEPCKIVTMPIQNTTFERAIQKWCGTGTNMTCIDRIGVKYPCHFFMPSSSGKYIKLDYILSQLQSDNLLDVNCEGCALAPCCPTCYGINYVETSDITKRNKNHCVFTKIRAKAAAYMLSNMLTNQERMYKHLESKSDSEIHNLIKGIHIVDGFAL